MPKKDDLTFLDHLDQFRVCLFQIIAAFVICSFLAYHYSDEVLQLFIQPIGKVVFTSLEDAFLTHIYVALWAGLFFSLPILLWITWRFVGKALTEKEARYVLIFGPLSLVLFLAGSLFAYFCVVPAAVKFLLGFSSQSIEPMIDIKSYISFVGNLLFGFGIVFETPLIIVFLTKIGIATPEFLIQMRKFAVVGIFIISAILTPPDIISQFLMAIPLLILYELGIVFAKLTQQKA